MRILEGIRDAVLGSAPVERDDFDHFLYPDTLAGIYCVREDAG